VVQAELIFVLPNNVDKYSMAITKKTMAVRIW
jgi:hypothetical protein